MCVSIVFLYQKSNFFVSHNDQVESEKDKKTSGTDEFGIILFSFITRGKGLIKTFIFTSLSSLECVGFQVTDILHGVIFLWDTWLAH